MSTLYTIVNPTVKADFDQRSWIVLGQTMRLGKHRCLRLMCDQVDGLYQPMLNEELNGMTVSSQPIYPDSWFLEPIPQGFLEIVPKAFCFDAVGRVERVLMGFSITPADVIFH